MDAVLLESVDGRPHLEQVKPVLKAHKPVFIDKPLAATLEDAREIARLAKAAGVPWFSSSSLRFGAIGTAMKAPTMPPAAPPMRSATRTMNGDSNLWSNGMPSSTNSREKSTSAA